MSFFSLRIHQNRIDIDFLRLNLTLTLGKWGSWEGIAPCPGMHDEIFHFEI